MNDLAKPKVNHVNFYRTEGHFNLFNPKDKSAQYVFRFPHLTREQIEELGLRTSYLIDIEKDYDFSPEQYTALELTREIQHIYDNYYLFHGSSKDLNKLIEYLESIEEEQEKLRHEYKVECAKYQIAYWQDELEKLQVEVV